LAFARSNAGTDNISLDKQGNPVSVNSTTTLSPAARDNHGSK
jgi:hypothetical protein